MSDLKHTQRGFAYIEFQDRYDHKCSIQKSSLATEDAIWFGIDDANPQVLHGDALRLGIETDATSGWVPYPLPAEVSLATRMHLTQDHVRELLPTLIHFAETGDVLAPADCRTQPEATAPAQDLSAVKRIGLGHGSYIEFERKTSGASGWLLRNVSGNLVRALSVTEVLLVDAALASSANALSAGDRVDAERYRWLRDKARSVDWSEMMGNLVYRTHCRNDMKQMDKAIDAAILQSQKGGSHG